MSPAEDPAGVRVEELRRWVERGRTALRHADPVAVAAHVAFPILLALAVVGRPHIVYNDTDGYLHLDLTNRGLRMWTVPLVYKAAGSMVARVVVQTAIAAVCWSVAAGVTAARMRSLAARRTALVAVLVLGLSTQVTQWDLTLLSESIAISLTVLLVAMWLWFADRPSWPAAAGVVLATMLWAYTRQVQVMVTIALAVLALLLVVRRAHRSRHLGLAAGLLLVVAWGLPALFVDHGIARFNSSAIIVDRGLVDPARRSYLVAHGLPLTPDQAALAGKFERHETVFLDDPAWSDWVRNRWPHEYAGYLRQFPSQVVTAPARDFPGLMSGDTGTVYGEPRPVLPPPLQGLLYGKAEGDLLFLGVAALALFAARLRRAPVRATEWVGLAAVVLSVGWYELVWTLSATDLLRLAAPVAVGIRLALLVVAVAAVDVLLAPPLPRIRALPRIRVTRRRRGTRAPQPAAVSGEGGI